MIGYVTVGVSDLDKSAAFYDSLFSEIGAGRIMEMDGFVVWGTAMDKPAFSICKPHNGEACNSGNGNMTALVVKDSDQVAKLYNKALELGGSCEGEPGPRGEGGFYAGYFRDLDGNKFNAFCMTE